MKDIRLPGKLQLPQVLMREMDDMAEWVKQQPSILFEHLPLGFPWIDAALGGGLMAPDIMLILARQNVGKTSLVLQIARNIALWAAENDQPVFPLMISFEHDRWDLFVRMVCMESYLVNPENPINYHTFKDRVRDLQVNNQWDLELNGMDQLFSASDPISSRTLDAINRYSNNLMIWNGDLNASRIDVIEQVVQFYWSQQIILLPIIDYLQIIPPSLELLQHNIFDQQTVIDDNLRKCRGLTLKYQIPMILVSSVNNQALQEDRNIQLEDAEGPENLKFMVDQAICLNSEGRESEVNRIQFSLDKNRHGPAGGKMSHRRVGGQFCFESDENN